MTHHEKPDSKETTAETSSATAIFVDKFNRFLPRYSQEEGFEDMKEQARDLSGSVRDGELAHSQLILETKWPEDLNETRLDALVELHSEENGQPTAEQKNEAYKELQRTILKGERDTLVDERVRLEANLVSHDPDQIAEVIELIESEIGNLNIIPDDERRDRLRLARNVMHERYKGYKEIEEMKAQEQAEAAKRQELTEIRVQSDSEREVRAAQAREEIDQVFEVPQAPTPELQKTSPHLRVETDEEREARKRRTEARREATETVAEKTADTPESIEITEPEETVAQMLRDVETALDQTEAAEQKMKEAIISAHNILGNHANHHVVGEIIREIAQTKQIEPKELDRLLKERLRGGILPENFNTAPVKAVEHKIRTKNWPKPDSPVWAARDPRSALGKANLENRQVLRSLLEELLK